MASAANLVKELDHLAKWSQAQRDAGIPANLAANSQAEIVRKKISLLGNMTYDSSIELIEKINAVAPAIGWSQGESVKLVVAINAKMGRLDDGLIGCKTRRDNQECSTFELYFTSQEFADIG